MYNAPPPPYPPIAILCRTIGDAGGPSFGFVGPVISQKQSVSGIASRLIDFLSGHSGSFAQRLRLAIVICAIATVSGLLVGHALSFVVGPPWHAIGGGGWTILLIVIEGSIARGVHERSGRGRLWVVIARAGIAIPFACTIAHLGALAFFHTAISNQLLDDQRLAIQLERKNIEDQFQQRMVVAETNLQQQTGRQTASLITIQQQLELADDRRRAIAKDVISLAAKRRLWMSDSGIGHYTTTPEYEQAKVEERRLASNATKLAQQFAPDIEAKRLAIKSATSTHSKLIAQLELDRKQHLRELTEFHRSIKPGLLDQIEALSAVQKKSTSALVAVWMFSLLLVCLELLPITMKISEVPQLGTQLRETRTAILKEVFNTPRWRSVVGRNAYLTLARVMSTDLKRTIANELQIETENAHRKPSTTGENHEKEPNNNNESPISNHHRNTKHGEDSGIHETTRGVG
jgi:hypothetical protein